MQEEEIRLAATNLAEENNQILRKLVSIETLLSGKLQEIEKNLAQTSERVKELQQESIQMKRDITSLYNRPG